MTAQLGPFGVWARQDQLSPELAVEVEALGYGAIWIGGANGDLVLAESLLAATQRVTVATGIVNIWTNDATETARAYHRLSARFADRFLLGVGTGHREHIGASYQRPYEAMVAYLDALDAAGVPVEDRALAALGPKVMRLAAERTAAAHPYLTTPAHTRQAREILGSGVLLAPEQKVVLEVDPEQARVLARPAVADPYLGLVNYLNNLRRLGYTEEDLASPGSDRLIDALVAHGDPASAAARLVEHLDAGADHVAIQLLTAPDTDPVDGLRALATELRLRPGGC